MLERLSIEVTNRCQKGCWFCYSHSLPSGPTAWTADELVSFAADCAAHGVRAVSFGGGEPLEHPGIFEVLERLSGRVFRSLTTNGLSLDRGALDRLARCRPDKVHVSLHFPAAAAELARVVRQARELEQRGVRSGVNLLVARSGLDDAARAAGALRSAGIGNDRIVYLPMRGRDTPLPAELARVAGGAPFQSMTCLASCGESPRFAAVGWDKAASRCSYTASRRPLPALTFAALARALAGLGVAYCGDDERPAEGRPRPPGARLVSIRNRP